MEWVLLTHFSQYLYLGRYLDGFKTYVFVMKSVRKLEVLQQHITEQDKTTMTLYVLPNYIHYSN